jgi:AhpD family alkylhydroperoxidase
MSEKPLAASRAAVGDVTQSADRKEITMNARLNYASSPTGEKFTKYLITAGRVVKDSPLPATTQALVEIRASQINGCSVCLDMHTKDAEQAGETALRLNLVAAWREASVFTEAERAALDLAEQGTVSPTPPAASLRRAGRTRPSITTTTNSPRSSRSSPASTPGTASTSSLGSPAVTTSPGNGGSTARDPIPATHPKESRR